MIWQDGGQELESFAASCMNSLLENNLKFGFKNNPTEKQASKQGSDCFGVQITEGAFASFPNPQEGTELPGSTLILHFLHR